jgi:glycosyltransferase involved in cell wall biosynthesis
MKLTTIILTKNEESNITECLDSITFPTEILILDDMSNDKTIEKALKHKNVKIITHKMTDFASQRNFALGQIRTEWAFFLDADERVSPELSSELSKIFT